MPPNVLPAFPKRLINFATLAVGATEDVIIADRLPLIHWRELTMLVHVHDHSLISGAGTIQIRAAAQSWTGEDPTLQFVSSSAVWTATLSSTTPNPTYQTVPIATTGTNCLGAMVRLFARGNRTGAGALNATISVDFSSKDA